MNDIVTWTDNINHPEAAPFKIPDRQEVPEAVFLDTIFLIIFF